MARSKQGKFLPGSHIPIVSLDELTINQPDTLVLLPWNLINEISSLYPSIPIVTAIPYLTTHRY